MKSTELRLGNLIQVASTTQTIKSIITDSIGVMLETESYRCYIGEPFNTPKPIPLTEEWLLKFGFDCLKANGRSYLSKEVLYDGYDLTFCFWFNNGEFEKFWMLSDEAEVDGNYEEERAWGLPFKHVHKLQNLYFALTGKELKIKTNPKEVSENKKG